MLLLSKEKRKMNQLLWQAARDNSAEACREVLNYHMHGDTAAQVNSKADHDFTALHIAASEGSTDVCKVLLQCSDELDLNPLTTDGQTPLHIAAENGFLDIVQVLVNAGADVNLQDKSGCTALHLVARGGHVDTASWLLGKDPRVDIQDNRGNTAYQLASNREIAELFELYFTERKIPFSKTNAPRVASADSLIPKQDQIDRMLLKASAAPSPIALQVFIERAQHPVYDIQRSSRRKSSGNGFTRVEYRDFIPKYLLGRGSFGEVYLVVHRDTGKEYAMKVLNKDRIMGQNLVKYAITERNVLSYISHPFMVALNYAFQTPEKLVMIMDYCPGGDLGHVLKKERRFTELRARMYLCEVLLALEELHSRDIIYRDLKPDNVVLDAEGHALLTDFGLSKEGVTDTTRTQTFCGSLCYLAPEILRHSGHNKTVDWYLLGVLLYEMLTGQPPFYDFNQDQMFNDIVRVPVKIPIHVSAAAKDLLQKLLEKDPAQRLGSGPTGVAEIKTHPFFDGIDWEAVYRRELHPPVPMPRLQKKRQELLDEDVFGILGEETTLEDRHVPGWSFVQPGSQKRDLSHLSS